ncbi:hypothetical protein OKW30_004634 [Paraburkholderia sp. Clong3]|uniref:hypothetical protein n=1 Tax=Paraburkholderia sp. Clong3 TaxID=2991061 RepID=UPI003D24C3EA
MTLADLLDATYAKEMADLPRMLESDDPNERKRAEALQEQELRRALVHRSSAERLSASAPCPATAGEELYAST